LVGGGLLLTYVDPSCGRCSKQAEFIHTYLQEHPTDSAKIAFVSFSRDELIRWRDSLGLSCRLYHDANAMVGRRYNVTDFPCNIVLTSDLTVRKITFKPIVQEKVLDIVMRI
jgi:hypothetical protein